MLKGLSQFCVALLEFLEQSHVLDGDYGLGGEGLKQFDLLVSEGTNLKSADEDYTNCDAFTQQWGGKCGPNALTSGKGCREVVLWLCCKVMNVNSSPINHGSTGYTTPLNRSSLIRLGNWNCSVRGRWPKDVIICTVNYGVGSVTQPRRVLRHSIQNWLHVSRRAGDDTQDFTRGSLLFQ